MASIKIYDLRSTELENEVTALTDEDQANIQGGILPVLAGVAYGAMATYYGVKLGQEYSRSSLHDKKGKWWSFL